MILVILAVTFAIRAWPRLVCKNVIFSDTYYHLFCARVIRENAFRIPHRLPGVMLLPEYTYPFGYHLFLALFPAPVRNWLERLSGAVFDTLSVLVCYWFSVWAVGTMGSGASPYLPLLVAGLMSISPALLRLGSGPRAYNGCPRIVGQTLYLMHLLLAYYAFQTHSWLALTGSAVAGAALIVTAKFGNQVLVFFGIFFCLAISPLYALHVLGCVALAAVVTKGRALEILAAQVRHSLFYYQHMQSLFLHKYRRVFRLYWEDLIMALRSMKRGNPLWFIRWSLAEPHPVHLLVTSFTPFLLLPALVFLGIGQPLGRFLLVWIGAGLCWFVLTRSKALLFLGEGERYLEYALYPALFLTVLWLGTSPAGLCILGVLLSYSAVTAIWYGCAYVAKFRHVDQEYAGTLAAFSRLDGLEPGVILPIGPFHWQALYLSRFPVLTLGGNIDLRRLSLQEYMLLYGNYPHPSKHLDQILASYQVRYVVSDPVHLGRYFGEICGHGNSLAETAEVLADTKSLVIYRVYALSGQKAA
jgi:hypothetical protein